MALSSPIKVFDPIRKEHFIQTPEEAVRQGFLERLIKAGYPKELIQVEVAIKKLANQPKKPPKRRLDILCFVLSKNNLVPFLLVECKAIKITQKTFSQVLGYNYFVNAMHLCVVNQDEVFFGIANAKGVFQFVPRFYSYNQLVQMNANLL